MDGRETLAEVTVEGGQTSTVTIAPPPATDVLATAVDEGGGVFRYTFPPLPATYLAPLNDSPAFGADAGELTGQPLLPGTYTVVGTRNGYRDVRQSFKILPGEPLGPVVVRCEEKI